jgi:reactive intermediate/imine deaminase
MSDPIFHVFKDGPKMVAPYSHAVEDGNYLFVTGQMPIQPDGTVPEGIEAQTEVVFSNIKQIIERAGFAGGVILSARVFLTRFELHYQRMNRTYLNLFPSGNLPARTCVGVSALAGDCDIEIDVVVKRA